MDTFRKIRSGITDLKKEKEALKRNYEFLAEELSKIVKENSLQLKALTEKTGTDVREMAAVEEKIKKIEGSLNDVANRHAKEISDISKQSDNYKEALVEVGERIQKVQESAEVANKGIKEGKGQEKDLSVYVGNLEKKIVSLESLFDKTGELGKGQDALSSRIKSLENLKVTIKAIEERTASIKSSIDDKVGALDGKTFSNEAQLKKIIDAQSENINKLIDDTVDLRMSVQIINKDIKNERTKIADVKSATIDNKRKMEMLGNLETKIKNIESVKTGLIKGVESLKSVKTQMATLAQKTKDLDMRFSTADKAIETKVQSEASGLEKQISKSTGAMEKQMQERLKFLETSILEKSKTMETRLVDDNKQFGTEVNAKLLAMQKNVSKELEESKKLNSDLHSLHKELDNIKVVSDTSKTGTMDVKKQLASLGARVNSLESVRERVKIIEDAKDAILSGMGDLQDVKENVIVLNENTKKDIEKFGSDITHLKSGTAKNTDSLTKMNLSINNLVKEIAQTQEMASGLKTELVQTKKQVISFSKVREKLKNVEALEKSLEKKLLEIKPLQKDIVTLKNSLSSEKKDISNYYSELDKKIDFTSSSLERSIASNNANLVKLDTDLERNILDNQSIKKHMQGLDDKIAEVNKDVFANKSNLKAIETIKIKIRDIENMEKSVGKDLANINSLFKDVDSLKKEMISVKKDADNERAVFDTKLDNEITSLKKETAFNSTTVRRVSDEMKRADLDMQSLRKDIQSEIRELTRIKNEAESSTHKLAELEKIQIKLKEMEDGKEALTQAMENKLEEKMKFLETDMRQRGSNIQAKLDEKTKQMQEKSNYEIRNAKKDILTNSKSFVALKDRLDSLSRIEERLKFIESEKNTITRSVSSLEGIRTKQAEIDQKFSSLDKEVRELKSGMSRGFTDIRSQFESATTEKRNEFGSAVKAFLNTRGELNKKISGIDIMIGELEKRLNALSKVVSRVDFIERKMDRVSEKSSTMQRDVDRLERKGESGEKIMVVDLDKEMD